jgi:hypothetical protein
MRNALNKKDRHASRDVLPTPPLIAASEKLAICHIEPEQ